MATWYYICRKRGAIGCPTAIFACSGLDEFEATYAKDWESLACLDSRYEAERHWRSMTSYLYFDDPKRKPHVH